jgi:3-deoxy-D-manno-octulosonic acid kinase
MRLQPPSGFLWLHSTRRRVLVHETVEASIGALLLSLPHAPPPGSVPLASGRGGAYRITLDDGDVIVLRLYRRGGALARFNRETYWARPPRPFAELVTTDEARRRGVPVPEVLGARIDICRSGGYRGALVTRYLQDTETLWQRLRRGPDPEHRRDLTRGAGEMVRTLRNAGIYHPDLNLHNCIVRDQGGRPELFVVDLDRAGARRGALPDAQRDKMLQRLVRSARKLDPLGEVLAPADIAMLRDACNAPG